MIQGVYRAVNISFKKYLGGFTALTGILRLSAETSLGVS